MNRKRRKEIDCSGKDICQLQAVGILPPYLLLRIFVGTQKLEKKCSVTCLSPSNLKCIHRLHLLPHKIWKPLFTPFINIFPVLKVHHYS